MNPEETLDTYVHVFLTRYTKLDVSRGPSSAVVHLGGVRIDITDPPAAERVADMFLRAAAILEPENALPRTAVS